MPGHGRCGGISQSRLALLERSASTSGITISFLHGADVSTATLLELWSMTHTAGGSVRLIHAVASVAVTDPSLVQSPTFGSLDVVALPRSVCRNACTVSSDGYARIREVQCLYCDVTCEDRTSAADVSWQSGADDRTVYGAVPAPAKR